MAQSSQACAETQWAYSDLEHSRFYAIQWRWWLTKMNLKERMWRQTVSCIYITNLHGDKMMEQRKFPANHAKWDSWTDEKDKIVLQNHARGTTQHKSRVKENKKGNINQQAWSNYGGAFDEFFFTIKSDFKGLCEAISSTLHVFFFFFLINMNK